jgi:excinuclease UvrABC helicase subunit UvrB
MDDLNNLFNKLFGANPFQDSEGKLNINTNNLGEPDSVEKFTEDGVEYTKSVWETEEGTVTKIESYHSYEEAGLSEGDYNEGDMIYQHISPSILKFIDPYGTYNRMSPMTTEEKIDLLETKLEYCIEHEEYERAARLRDEIAELKKLQNA